MKYARMVHSMSNIIFVFIGCFFLHEKVFFIIQNMQSLGILGIGHQYDWYNRIDRYDCTSRIGETACFG